MWAGSEPVALEDVEIVALPGEPLLAQHKAQLGGACRRAVRVQFEHDRSHALRAALRSFAEVDAIPELTRRPLASRVRPKASRCGRRHGCAEPTVSTAAGPAYRRTRRL
jgi:hypothetical protein